MPDVRPEPGSFRDPTGAVLHVDGRVVRALDARGAADWKAVRDTRFLARLMASGAVIGTREAPAEVMAAVAAAGVDGWEVVLEHDRVPFVSYPYEWTFEMLRDAAARHLEVLLAALDEGVTTKDGYAYNLQFQGASPVFIDVGSFQAVGAGGPWVGYQQFCRTLLYPLLLQAHLDLPFQRYLAGHLEGIPPHDLRRLLGGRGLLQKGVLRHVVLPEVLTSRVTQGAESTRKELAAAGAGTEITKATARTLLELVRALRSKRSSSGWADYRATCSYSDADTTAKRAFVEEHLARLQPGLVFDLGCNDGAFARLAAAHAGYVVAVDADDVVVDGLYQSLLGPGQPANILPLVVDLADPSPGRGWRNLERHAFFERARPDLVMGLALVHHLAIAANVPLAQVVDWFASLGGTVLVEFVERHDPMVQRLLANKPPGIHDGYTTEAFEALLEARFDVSRRLELPGGSRRLYLATPRS